MALDPLEKDRLRRKMAARMQVFLEGTPMVTCVSGHCYEEPHACDLCGDTHAMDLFVIKNRSGKKMLVASGCLKEMVRFQVTDVEELSKWLEKLKVLNSEMEVRKAEAAKTREEERRRLEKKVIIRKKN
ncbi:hypothetical protein EBT16_11505 [bacterium]|nr:hypothetical protein [bacterium]